MISGDIKRLIDETSHFGIAVSGGADSMALLTWIALNYDVSKYDVINVEHGIRGDNSIRDTEFVQEYCKARGINCIVTRVDAPKFARDEGCTLEQAARLLRHKVFAEYSAQNNCVVMTAHHADDQAESILMHIARGCGINGLRGMSVRDGNILRPLLNTSKADIDLFVARNSVPFVTDETNGDSAYSRNFMRNEVIPLIETKYPGFKNNLRRLGNIAVKYENYINSGLPEIRIDNEGAIKIDLRNLHEVAAFKCVGKACSLLGVNADIEEKHFTLILNMKDNDRIDLPHGIYVYRENGKTTFVKSERGGDVYQFGIGEFYTGYGKLIISADGGNGFKQIDADKIPLGTVIRTRREGDRIELDYGGKNVGKFLTDRKIPRRLKDFVPIAAIGVKALLIGDMAVAESVKTDKDSKNILHVKWIR